MSDKEDTATMAHILVRSLEEGTRTRKLALEAVQKAVREMLKRHGSFFGVGDRIRGPVYAPTLEVTLRSLDDSEHSVGEIIRGRASALAAVLWGRNYTLHQSDVIVAVIANHRGNISFQVGVKPADGRGAGVADESAADSEEGEP